MKFLAVFVAILAVSSGSQWTIHELSEALQNPNTDPAMIPLLEDALNQMMEIIWAGGHIEAISVGSPVAVNPISVTDPISPTPVVEPVSSDAPLVQIIVNVGKQQEAQPAAAPVTTEWTLHELSEALQNPNTDPALIPLLEDALNQLMLSAWSGGQVDTIAVTSPVAPAPVVESASTDPLVQIIVNVANQQEAQPEIPRPVPEVVPIVPGPVILPTPVAPEVVIPEPVILPAPVAPEVVIPEPVILPAPVAPEVVINPIDVIAITAPIVNPVDLINPIPVVAPVSASEAVGPIV